MRENKRKSTSLIYECDKFIFRTLTEGLLFVKYHSKCRNQLRILRSLSLQKEAKGWDVLGNRNMNHISI